MARLNRLYTVTLAILLTASAAWAQQWQIVRTGADLEALERTVSALVRDGYVPVGLDLSEERGVAVLVTRSPLLTSGSWRIHEASSPERATEEFTALIEAGYLIMDVSISGDSIVGLFSMSPAVVGGWRIVQSAPNFFDANAVVTRFQTDGFTAWGVSAAPEGIWHLMVRFVGDRRYQTILVGVPAAPEEETVTALTGLVAEGWIPWGLSIREDEYLVRLIRVDE